MTGLPDRILLHDQMRVSSRSIMANTDRHLHQLPGKAEARRDSILMLDRARLRPSSPPNVSLEATRARATAVAVLAMVHAPHPSVARHEKPRRGNLCQLVSVWRDRTRVKGLVSRRPEVARLIEVEADVSASD